MKYSTEFKQEEVKLSYQWDNIKELAIELGIDVARIYKWRTSHRVNNIESASASKDNEELGKLVIKERDVARLKKYF